MPKLTRKIGEPSRPLTKDVFFIDTETEPVEDGYQAHILTCVEHWETDEWGLKDKLKGKYTFFDIFGFWDLVTKNLPCRVVAHNWNFDGQVLRILDHKVLSRYQCTVDMTKSILSNNSQNSPFALRLIFGKNLFIDFMDSFNFFKQSLDDLGQSYGKSKLPMPKIKDYSSRGEYINDLAHYCRRDVEIVRDAWFYLFQFTKEIGNCTPDITIASTALRVFRNMFIDRTSKAQKTEHKKEVMVAEANAYYGGRSEAIMRGTNPKDCTFWYDVVAQYGAIQMLELPVRFEQEVKDFIPDTEGVMHLAQVKIEVPLGENIGPVPVRDEEGGIFYPVGKIEGTYWEPELKLLQKKGWIKEWVKIWEYSTEPIFRTYVTAMTRLKQKYKTAGDKPLEQLAKLFGNVMYGKTGQRKYPKAEYVDPASREYRVIFRDGPTFIDFIDGTGEDTEFDFPYTRVGVDLWKDIKPEEKEFATYSIPSIAGAICSFGRVQIASAMMWVEEQGGVNYRCDTDGFTCNIELDPTLIGSEPGKFELEAKVPGKDVYIVTDKHYLKNGEIRVKGSKNPKDVSGYSKQLQFSKLTTRFRSKDPEVLGLPPLAKQVIKEPTGINRKRINNGEGEVTSPKIVAMW